MKPLMVTLAILRGADAAATCIALADTRAAEQNPLFGSRPSCAVVIGVQTIALTAQIAGAKRLSDSHPTGAKWLLVGFVVAEGFAVAWNARELQRLR